MLYAPGTLGPPGAVHRSAHPRELDRHCAADGPFRGLWQPPIREGGEFDQGIRAADGKQSNVDLLSYFKIEVIFCLYFEIDSITEINKI